MGISSLHSWNLKIKTALNLEIDMKDLGICASIFDALLSNIINNVYPDNILPGENDLCSILNVSRTTIRAVLEKLQAKGVITKLPKKKTEINPIRNWNWLDHEILNALYDHLDHKELLSHVFYLRFTFEPRACALSALNSTIEDLNKMATAFAKMQQGLMQGDRALFKQGDIELHSSLFISSHNPFFASLSELIINTSVISIENTIESSQEDMQTALALHGKLIDAIRIKDPLEAQKIMNKLLQDSIAQIFTNNIPEYIAIFK